MQTHLPLHEDNTHTPLSWHDICCRKPAKWGTWRRAGGRGIHGKMPNRGLWKFCPATAALCRYFVAFTFDTTLGVALAIGFHTLALNAAKHNAKSSQFAARVAECGSYGEAPAHLRWSEHLPQISCKPFCQDEFFHAEYLRPDAQVCDNAPSPAR